MEKSFSNVIPHPSRRNNNMKAERDELRKEFRDHITNGAKMKDSLLAKITLPNGVEAGSDIDNILFYNTRIGDSSRDLGRFKHIILQELHGPDNHYIYSYDAYDCISIKHNEQPIFQSKRIPLSNINFGSRKSMSYVYDIRRVIVNQKCPSLKTSGQYFLEIKYEGPEKLSESKLIKPLSDAIMLCFSIFSNPSNRARQERWIKRYPCLKMCFTDGAEWGTYEQCMFDNHELPQIRPIDDVIKCIDIEAVNSSDNESSLTFAIYEATSYDVIVV